ncbi:hypothetical protein CDL15_Pgr002287 [Punica granatum]|uniref:Uncharacterized protein n=1 Tax=Punica granatum TaxID=22663 RepID=A0A218XUL0_PUNGR|nr:hypothetical protein CDL15_Pgr002287 [Punica granatum]
MEGSIVDGTYTAPATSSTTASGIVVGASTSTANFGDEQICEDYETYELKSLHDKDLEDENISEKVKAVCIERDVDSKGKGCP